MNISTHILTLRIGRQLGRWRLHAVLRLGRWRGLLRYDSCGLWADAMTVTR